MDHRSTVLHLINSIGDSIDTKTAVSLINELLTRNLITLPIAKLMTSAISDRPYQTVPSEYRDNMRAAILKTMLLSTCT